MTKWFRQSRPNGPHRCGVGRDVEGWRSRVLLPLLWLVSAPAHSAALNVAIVVSNDTEPYIELAQGVASELRRDGVGRARTIGVDALAQLNGTDADMVVAVGLKAAQAIAAKNLSLPVLNTLIPKTSFDRIARQRSVRSNRPTFSAIYLDQPISRQLDLVRLALPDKKRIGVIVGPDSEELLESLRTEAQLRELELNAVRIGSEAELFPALESVLGSSDVFLSLPDSMVFNSRTLQSILFTAYRRQIPVVGFSPAYVRAGALFAVHSTPAQLARQVAEVLRRVNARDATLPPPQYPGYYTVAVNYHVARSLEIALESEEFLAIGLKGQPSRP